MRHKLALRPGLEAGGAPVMWERVVRDTLLAVKELVPAGSRVLEVGYGDGLLTCYLCQKLDWRVLGLEVDHEVQRLAQQHARQYGLSDRLEFWCGEAEEVFQHRGQYDAVFIKTVLYSSPSLKEYSNWLEWVLSVLRPGGIFINFETGRANTLTQLYRRLRQRSYTCLSLYTSQVESIYDSHFAIIERRYYGGLSQFLAPLPALYSIASWVEESLQPRNADNCFIVSIIARRPG